MSIKAEFDVPADCMVFTTKTNGDHITIDKVHLGQEAASNLASLINTPNGLLRVIIKRKGEV
jgi:hypothetical protein